MSEMKRVELTTVSSSQKQKKVKWKQSTYRFVVTLSESNSETCPEYSFADFVKNDKPLNGTPFDEPDEDKEVAAIAQRFEAKYGPKGLYSGKRKRTQEMDDYYDPGEGYDEDDPFIDNTEAHDEVVPAIMTTQHGGFYINQGKLDFRYLDEDSSEAFISTQEVKKQKKRPLDSESEEETGAAIAKKFKAMKAMKRKKQLESKDGEKQRRKHSGPEDRENFFKKKKAKNLDRLKLQKPAPDSIPQKEVTTPSVPSASVTTPSGMPASPFVMITPTKTTAAALTNHTADVPGTSDPAQDGPDALLQDAMKEDSSSKSGDEGKGDNQSSDKNTQLPPQLPAELLQLIDNIKREAKECKEKKLRFFSDGVNKLLLDIDLASRNLPMGNRTTIYSHLGEHLPCGKYTLHRRTKKLRESQMEGQLKLPMQKLKEAVMKVMPGLEEQHELDVQKAKSESELKGDTADVREEASTESEEEEKSDRKKPRVPRRKFQWNSEIRDLLLDIVSTKIKLFNTCKSRNQTPEEYLKAFLDSEIKPIWPQGWIQTRMLFKESKKALEDLIKSAPQPGKPRKAATTNDALSSQVENTPVHMSKTEDVIEISSTLESDEDKNSPVVVNSSGSKVSVLGQGAPLSTSTSSHSTPLTPSIGQVTTPSFKAPMASTPVTHQSPSSTALTQKTVDTSPVTTLKRVTPTPVPGSKSIVAKSLAPALSSAALAAAVRAPGSGAQQQANNQPASLRQKSAPSQQTANSQQHKLPQELPKAANPQQNKAAIRSSPELGSTHNSPWANVNSVVPASKSINPFVAVHRIPETTTQKLSLGVKSSNLSLQKNQTGIPPTQHQEKALNNTSAGLKPQMAVTKPQQSETNTSSNAIFSDMSQVKKPVAASQNSMSSRPDSQTRTVVHYNDSLQKNSHSLSPHVKSEIVGDNSASQLQNSSFNSVQTLNQQNQSAKQASGIGSGSLQPNAHGNTDVASRNNYIGGVRQHSPPAKLLVSSERIPVPILPPVVLLDISSSSSMSSSNSPSPQKSPVSPEGNAARSLYEQIKSQIFNQEAMEDKALKNLALALNCGGSSASGLFGNGGDAGNQSGSR